MKLIEFPALRIFIRENSFLLVSPWVVYIENTLIGNLVLAQDRVASCENLFLGLYRKLNGPFLDGSFCVSHSFKTLVGKDISH